MHRKPRSSNCSTAFPQPIGKSSQRTFINAQPNFLTSMTSSQRAELNAGLAEADRGEGAAEADVFLKLEQKFGVKLG